MSYDVSMEVVVKVSSNYVKKIMKKPGKLLGLILL